MVERVRKEFGVPASATDCVRIKVISMGEGQTGKSCLIKRYCEDRFVQKYIPTVGVDYGVKRVYVGEQEVKVNFWDLAGPSTFFEVRNEFYKDTQGALLVFDVTKRSSFDAIDEWVKEGKRYGLHAGGEAVMILVGNKIDAKARKVSRKEANDYALQRGMTYWEASAATGENVKELFEDMFAKVIGATQAAYDAEFH